MILRAAALTPITIAIPTPTPPRTPTAPSASITTAVPAPLVPLSAPVQSISALHLRVRLAMCPLTARAPLARPPSLWRPRSLSPSIGIPAVERRLPAVLAPLLPGAFASRRRPWAGVRSRGRGLCWGVLRWAAVLGLRWERRERAGCAGCAGHVWRLWEMRWRMRVAIRRSGRRRGIPAVRARRWRRSSSAQYTSKGVQIRRGDARGLRQASQVRQGGELGRIDGWQTRRW